MPGPPEFGAPDTSDHVLTRQGGSVIEPTNTSEQSFHCDSIIPLLLSDQLDIVNASTELAFLVHSTALGHASDHYGKWDRVLAMPIQRKKDGTAERLAIVSLSGTDWSDAPVTAEYRDIILV